jgi:hypothetical protein
MRWQDVHRMFYEAMLDAGVEQRQARVMYTAVRYAGPRWNDQAILNARLAAGLPASLPAKKYPDPVEPGRQRWSEPVRVPPLVSTGEVDPTEFRQLSAFASDPEITLDELDHVADLARSPVHFRPGSTGASDQSASRP